VSSVTRSRRQVRLSRALGLALTPKAVKHFEKRPYPPGEHGRARRRTESDYAVRLREKQRLRAQYALREKQMARAYEDARKAPGLTGEALVENLETRLDALVLRSGFARTILQARQVVVHRHMLVDGKIVVRDRKLTTVDETTIYEAVKAVMPEFRKDFAAISARVAKLQPWLDSAHRKIMGADLDIERLPFR